MAIMALRLEWANRFTLRRNERESATKPNTEIQLSAAIVEEGNATHRGKGSGRHPAGICHPAAVWAGRSRPMPLPHGEPRGWRDGHCREFS